MSHTIALKPRQFSRDPLGGSGRFLRRWDPDNVPRGLQRSSHVIRDGFKPGIEELNKFMLHQDMIRCASFIVLYTMMCAADLAFITGLFVAFGAASCIESFIFNRRIGELELTWSTSGLPFVLKFETASRSREHTWGYPLSWFLEIQLEAVEDDLDDEPPSYHASDI